MKVHQEWVTDVVQEVFILWATRLIAVNEAFDESTRKGKNIAAYWTVVRVAVVTLLDYNIYFQLKMSYLKCVAFGKLVHIFFFYLHGQRKEFLARGPQLHKQQPLSKSNPCYKQTRTAHVLDGWQFIWFNREKRSGLHKKTPLRIQKECFFLK